MQEEVENRTVQLAVQVGKVSLKKILQGLGKWVSENRNKLRQKRVNKHAMKQYKNTNKKGMQTVTQLIGQNQGVSSIEVKESDIKDFGIKDFKKIANKFGVDFAIMKDKNNTNVPYTIFFKARDADAIMAVLSEYGNKRNKQKAKNQDKQKEKPVRQRQSIRAKLKKFKEKVANIPKKRKEKRKELDR